MPADALSGDRELPDPLYRVLGRPGGFWVNIWSDDWPRSRDVAFTTTREGAMAVLRLHEVTEFHDWTTKDAHWGMPTSEVDSA